MFFGPFLKFLSTDLLGGLLKARGKFIEIHGGKNDEQLTSRRVNQC